MIINKNRGSSMHYPKILVPLLSLLLLTSIADAKKKKAKKAKNQAIADKPLLYQEGGGFKPAEIIKYKEVKERPRPLELHMFYPEGFKKTDSRPTALLFFGGGWSGYNPMQFYPQAAYLASRGMVAICATYRANSYYKTKPYDCVEDAKSAVRYLRKHSKEMGINPNKLAVGGGSAGGHLAAATATIKGWDCPEDDLSISAVPNALLLYNPVFDNGPGGYANNEKDDRVKEYWQKISPLHNLDGNQPPTIVFMGSLDKHTSVEKTNLYDSTMEKNGNRCETFIYEGQKHGFFNMHKNGSEYFCKLMIEADKFLVSLEYLTGKNNVDTWIADQLKRK